ncbi:MAG: PTS transporter subunit EIIC [Lactobacillus sp.]|jgi:PTS system cellobiose-specific IIC component|uniref:Permease IIC component n=1 Tax=Lacticaseibacillus suilingensis TaxID=2799577 RepID=A0ABW4BGL5_9LACO|nr:PTS transporter subunit EIIC [Lacticaseibacillus suilingensis]MCI1894155.1 PTS transporter subunit EIIC [Lactobacillus sp.]MCI1917988.1 PTS transporter subunit EIIC [Lactobacillus sp.]MCI1941471.1 PTS transporter subunit EIIC [Lactobacillus sp.]MCI1972018.1 PTS transporter subunit EIIC [Lactobacillus sp.]MCI2016139.1 PTS transporter subunit EIIC [Lactobacillus sp.]
METSPKPKFSDRFVSVAGRIGAEVHLQSLRDTFSILMPFFVLAGLGTLLNSVLFPVIFKGDTLVQIQTWGGLINNATLNICGLLVAPICAYTLAQHKGFSNPIGAAAVAIGALITFMPLTNQIIPTGATKAVSIAGAVMYTDLGTQSMFAGVIVGLLVTELFMTLANNKHLQINLGENVPPQVGKSFAGMIPTILTISICALLSALMLVFLNKDLITLIATFIQEPLRRINTSLPGYLLIFSLGNLLFTFGIHQAVIFGTVLEPLLIVNINENAAAFAKGVLPPNILTKPFVTVFAQMGGSGCTIALLLAILIFSRYTPSRRIGALSFAPGIFNINEPLIYGFPIVFNLPMMIPFVGVPFVLSILGYALTAMGWVSRTVVFIPWMTPPLISGYLATGGDWRAVVIQIVFIALATAMYLPFLKISDRVTQKQAEASADQTVA